MLGFFNNFANRVNFSLNLEYAWPFVLKFDAINNQATETPFICSKFEKLVLSTRKVYGCTWSKESTTAFAIVWKIHKSNISSGSSLPVAATLASFRCLWDRSYCFSLQSFFKWADFWQKEHCTFYHGQKGEKDNYSFVLWNHVASALFELLEET